MIRESVLSRQCWECFSQTSYPNKHPRISCRTGSI